MSNLRALASRIASLSNRTSEKLRPAQVTIHLPFAGVLPIGEHRRGLARAKVVSREERRAQLAWLDPADLELVLVQESNQSEPALARHVDVALKVIGLNSEQAEKRMAELMAKMTAEGKTP